MFSLLNPEAPEFYPHWKEYTQNGLQTIQKTIQTSNMFPAEASYCRFKTFTDFNILTCQLSSNVLEQSNFILSAETEGIKLRNNDNENNMDKIIETNDTILDRTNTNIDIVCGLHKPTQAISIDAMKNPLTHQVASWNSSPIISKIEMGSATLIGAKNIPRPQLKFKDTIDNSNSLWVPKISDKPNSIKPLALKILCNDEGEAVGFEHPYQVELELFAPASRLVEADAEPPTFPAPLEQTPLTFVETAEQLDALIDHLLSVDEIAVDVEHHSYRTYQGITCLIQLTTETGGDFIIDALTLRENLYKLNLVFTNPKKLKVFHGAEMDVLWLQRDFGVYIVGLFDTFQAARLLKLTGLSLKHLLIHYCKIVPDKKYQLADWRIRPLPQELVTYARVDTHYLLYMWRRMKAELLAAAHGQDTLLQAVFQQSKLICGSTYNKPMVHDESHLSIYTRSKKSFNSRQMSALKLLYKWRDSQARELDESTMYLLPNHMLLALAETLPREVQGVVALCSPMPPFVKQNLVALHRILLTCRELPLEPQLYQVPSSINTMITHHRVARDYSFHDFSHFPDSRGDLPLSELKVDPSMPVAADIAAFSPPSSPDTRTRMSELNVDAKSFIPPFERYKKYRSLAQIEEIKEFKEKEAKIAAIGKEDDLIKNEVLSKLKEANPLQKDESHKNKYVTEIIEIDNKKRKRKMPSGTQEQKNKETETKPFEDSSQINTKNDDLHRKKTNKNEPITKDQVVKPYEYRNADYKKFHQQSDNIRTKKQQQPRIKCKKYKK